MIDTSAVRAPCDQLDSLYTQTAAAEAALKAALAREAVAEARVADALASAPEPAPRPMTVAEAGRKGGKLGGAERAKRLTPGRRAEIAKAAAVARWHGTTEPPAAVVRFKRPYGVMVAKVRAALKDGPVGADALAAVHGPKVRRTLFDMRRKGELVSPAKGVYQLADWTPAEPEAPPIPVVKAPTVNLSVSQHALDRYHEHYPNAGYGDLLADVRADVAVEPDLAQTLAGRTQPPKNSRYVLSSGRRGMFAIAQDVSPERVVTYLRFEAAQQAFVTKHFPEARP